MATANGDYLGDLDTTLPNGATQDQSVLDDFNREARRTTKNTIGTEHDIATGAHKFPHGDSASRPIVPVPLAEGRWYFNEEYHQLDRYDRTTDPANPAFNRLRLHTDQSITLFGNQHDNGWCTVGVVDSIPDFYTQVFFQPAAMLGQFAAYRPLSYTDVYLLKGTYEASASISIGDWTITGDPYDNVALKLVVAGTSIQVTAATILGTFDYNVTASPLPQVVIPADGWYEVTVEAQAGAASKSLRLQRASLWMQRVTNG